MDRILLSSVLLPSFLRILHFFFFFVVVVFFFFFPFRLCHLLILILIFLLVLLLPPRPSYLMGTDLRDLTVIFPPSAVMSWLPSHSAIPSADVRSPGANFSHTFFLGLS